MADPPEPPAARPGRALAWAVALAAALCLASVAALQIGAAHARPARLSFGPNDPGYVEGFRNDWERDGHTRFRWTGQRAAIALPVSLRGDGGRLRMRLRRHFPDPARVTVRVEGRRVADFEIAAERDTAYRLESLPLPPLHGRHRFRVELEVGFDNPRPLGVALDWLAVDRGAGSFALPAAAHWRAAAAVLVAFLAVAATGAGARLGAGLGALLVGSLGAGAWLDVLALERTLREGFPAWILTALLALLLLRLPATRRFFGNPSPRAAGLLVGLVLVGLALRLALLLHPLYFYPDVRVHGLFTHELARRGLMSFLSDFTVNQYRHSLGLQFENGHWYAFPYPPAFYLLTWPFVTLLSQRAEVAVAVLGALANALEPLLVFGLARALARPARLALVAAAIPVLLPLFGVRLALAYFPALFGHALDAVALLFLLRRLERLGEWRSVLPLGGLVAIALLAYTQALVNFGLLFGSLLLAQALWDRAPGARRRWLGLAAAGALGALLALAVFYGRYVPVFIDMQRGIPMADEQILLDSMARQKGPPAEPEAPDDPYAGPGVDPLRGARKAGWRLWLFYGPFGLLVVVGWLALTRSLPAAPARFVACWGLVYLWLNLGSGGLPGPNLLRYTKDLEVIAPLSCLSLAVCLSLVWRRGPWGRLLALLLGGAFLAVAALRWRESLLSTFDLTGY